MKTLNCKIYENIQMSKNIDKDKEYELCKNCDKCYVSKSCKALLTVGRDTKRIALKLGIGIYEDYNKKGELIKKTDVHTHMLRGTFATRCAEAKIAPVVLKQILGHKDITVTMKYYVDVDGSFIESETDNAIQYLVDKNIFGVEIPVSNVA